LTVYRLASRKYPPNSGKGAALHGGRWNLPGIEVIYASATISLGILEVLVHYSALPGDFVVTPIEIPDSVQSRMFVDPAWTPASPLATTQHDGTQWVKEAISVVTSIPSFVVPSERNYLLNPAHPDFASIRFLPSEPFRFDPRLRPIV
jgi:RES domain-containing protein